MSCPRCQESAPAADASGGPRWCAACERAYDAWSRRHASDIIGPALVGMVLISVVGLGLPLLGAGYLAGTAGVFAGFGALVGLQRLNRRRRRKQFELASLPRAYLPAECPPSPGR